MPTLSQGKRQQNLLNSGFLDLLAEDKSASIPIDLDAISGTLIDMAIQYAELARENLGLADRVATGALADSIIPTEVMIFGSVYQVEISVASYYKFVDEGVKGWADTKGGSSPYQFKKTFPSKKMVTAIRKWVIREGLKGKGKENAHKKASKRDQARAKISDTSTQTATGISMAIKKNGLRPSHFWSRTQDEMTRRIKEEMGKALKIDIINNALT